ncbi:MAG TPA: hypothetical protein VN577_10010 [Terriglobales bacterium]|nr:hypothetical protein [Terriglobales bacterium]
MKHPHPDKRHVMVSTRRYLLGAKRHWGTARSLVHYKALIQTYLEAKRRVIEE